MVDIKKRQEKILKIVIKEYIKTARPVSSFDILKKYDMRVCSATLRNDMFFLTRSRFLYKPYSSSGRVPTTKGYKFFVERIQDDSSNKGRRNILASEIYQWNKRQIAVNHLLEYLSSLASGLLVGYLPDQNLILEQGWKKVLFEPEFKEEKCLAEFVKTIYDFEENIERVFQKIKGDLEIFIGKDNPINRTDNFSFILCRPSIEKGRDYLFALVGPKRMPYQRNISLMRQVSEIFT